MYTQDCTHWNAILTAPMLAAQQHHISCRIVEVIPRKHGQRRLFIVNVYNPPQHALRKIAPLLCESIMIDGANPLNRLQCTAQFLGISNCLLERHSTPSHYPASPFYSVQGFGHADKTGSSVTRDTIRTSRSCEKHHTHNGNAYQTHLEVATTSFPSLYVTELYAAKLDKKHSSSGLPFAKTLPPSHQLTQISTNKPRSSWP